MEYYAAIKKEVLVCGLKWNDLVLLLQTLYDINCSRRMQWQRVRAWRRVLYAKG